VNANFIVPPGLGGLHIIDIGEKNTPTVTVLYTNNNLVIVGALAPGACFLWNQGGTLLFVPSIAAMDDVVAFTGSGLPSSVSLDLVDWNGNIQATFTTTASGTVPTGQSITIPATADTNQVAGISASGAGFPAIAAPTLILHDSPFTLVAIGNFLIAPKATLTPSSGNAGTQVTVTGSGLMPAATYYISQGAMYEAATATPAPQNLVILGQFVADGQGLIPVGTTVTIPQGAAAGVHTIDVGSLQLPPGGVGTPQYVTTLFQPKPAFTVGGALASINVTPNTVQMAIGATQQLVATGYDAAHISMSITPVWTSSNTTAATVDATGMVTGLTNGRATITATAQGISGHATVTVGTGGPGSLIDSYLPPGGTPAEWKAGLIRALDDYFATVPVLDKPQLLSILDAYFAR
jgi:hypothetical protein